MNFIRNNILEYFDHVGAIMTGTLQIARTFRNAADVGSTREAAYLDFLKRSLPAKLSITFGGYIFNKTYIGSPQVDIIVASENAFRFGLATPVSDTAIVRAEDTLAVIECKSVMRGKIKGNTKNGNTDEEEQCSINISSDMYKALANIRATKLVAAGTRPVGVLFALDWEGVNSTNDAANEILAFVQHMSIEHRTTQISEFQLLPQVIHIHEKYIIFLTKRGDKYGAITNNFGGVDEGVFVILEKPYVNLGFAVACEKIAWQLSKPVTSLYADLTAAYVDRDLGANNKAEFKFHWLSARPLWSGRGNSSGSDYHQSLTVTVSRP